MPEAIKLDTTIDYAAIRDEAVMVAETEWNVSLNKNDWHTFALYQEPMAAYEVVWYGLKRHLFPHTIPHPDGYLVSSDFDNTQWLIETHANDIYHDEPKRYPFIHSVVLPYGVSKTAEEVSVEERIYYYIDGEVWDGNDYREILRRDVFMKDTWERNYFIEANASVGVGQNEEEFRRWFYRG